MPDLLHRPFGTRGHVHAIDPARAGWRHVGFDLHRLHDGDRAEGGAPGRECILVVVEGHARIEAAHEDWGVMGDRASVFERTPPHALYVPQSAPWSAVAQGGCTLAVCSAPATTDRAAVRLGPEGIAPVTRGTGTNTRHIHNIAMEDRDVADSLLVTEVFTPAGHWSSYPSHRHDEDDPPRITYLEETYYHRLDPPDGWAVQRVYTDDRSLDETMAVYDHDLVCVPRGHHPCGAPYGFDLYYLNVMAGPRRQWRFAPAPEVEWILRRDT